jgi:hypothetical protein
MPMKYEYDFQMAINVAETYHRPGFLQSLFNAVLTAPSKLRAALGDRNHFDVIWDTGASLSVTPCRDDFVGQLRPPSLRTTISGIARGVAIRGEGVVSWNFHDDNGGLRTIRLPAYYTPDIKVRLLSVSSLMQTYSDELLTAHSHGLTLSGNELDPKRRPVAVPINPANNLPTSVAYHDGALESGAAALSAAITSVSEANQNLSPAEKELLRWHYRLGHQSFRRIQALFRTGVLGHSEASRRLQAAAVRITSPPKCAACQFGKQTQRPAPGKVQHRVTDREGALKKDDLFPGQRVSVDHFHSHTKGRLFTGYGKAKETDLYCGGCIFIDHASSYIHVELQTHFSSEQTLKAKQNFELACRDVGVVPTGYLTDNGSAFTSADYTKHLSIFRQQVKHSGVGAHHHNGNAERSIRTIMELARTMMLHSAIHWPEQADAQLWPMAVQHAVYLWNRTPALDNGLAPLDVFTRTRWEQKHFHDLHVWGCPVYVLDSAIHGGNKIARWKPRSSRSFFLGFSPKFASSVPLVLNPDSGAITSQFHVMFDDWFATVAAGSEPPDFTTDAWRSMFGEYSEYHLELTEDDDEDPAPPAPDPVITDALRRQALVRDAVDSSAPVAPLPVLMPPAVPPTPPLPVAPPLPAHPVAPPAPPQRENTVGPPPVNRPEPPPPPVPRPPVLPLPVNPAPVPVPPAPPAQQRERPAPLEQREPPAPLEQRELRRSTRDRRAPARLGNWQYLADATPNSVDCYAAFDHRMLHSAYREVDTFHDYMVSKAATSDPDTLSYDEAMNSPERPQWMAAAQDEISQLESKHTWDEVPVEDAKTKILPGTWVFRRKRTPDGTVKKYKARYCVRGDLQEGEFETFAPVVAWSTVRMFLVFCLTMKWHIISIDFSNAFVQARLDDPVWIHLPRGFSSSSSGRTCLRLKKSLYGLAIAPRLWYKHLFRAFYELGFRASAYDPCLLVRPGMLIVCYVDDAGIGAANERDIDGLIAELLAKGFELKKEGSFAEFLGIKIRYMDDTVILTQTGLIRKVIEATGLTMCTPNRTPASVDALGDDEDGPPMSELWSYPSIVGMLLYLSTNTRPDIAFAVSQAARFTSRPRQSHAIALKMIVRYLAGTADKGMIIRPSTKLTLELYVDADFAGLHNRETARRHTSAHSRTGYIIFLANFPLVWKSHLQSKTACSTLEAEYCALSTSLRTLLPTRSMLLETCARLRLPPQIQSSIRCTAFEDNNGALILATEHRLTNRTRYFHVEWHFFWEWYDKGYFAIVRCETTKQRADMFTKGLSVIIFEGNRKLSIGW